MSEGLPTAERTCGPEAGIALVTTLLVVLVLGALVLGAVILGSNRVLLDRYLARQATLGALADAGLEVARARLNGDPSLLPESGFAILEDGRRVLDGDGDTIPGVKRWTYLGPNGVEPRQEPRETGRGVNIVSVVRGDGGGIAIRRQLLLPQSFAVFGHFSGSADVPIHFGGGEHVWGPVHSNGGIILDSAGATFFGPVSSSENIQGSAHGDFRNGLREGVAVIQLPGRQEILELGRIARAGRSAFDGTMAGGEGEATTRIEFVAVDLNQDGDRTDEDEGFFRVYRSHDPGWVAARPRSRRFCSTDQNGDRTCRTEWDPSAILNCSGARRVRSPEVQDPGLPADDLRASSVGPGTGRCFLGGADEIWGGFVARDPKGEWIPWEGSPDPRVLAARPEAAPYLHPLGPTLNPGFRGVIFVDGKVLVSGEIRGRVTLVATGNIILGDDLTYVTDPSVGSCQDVAGYVSVRNVVVANNAINAPWRSSEADGFRSYDESTGEFMHGVVLALESFVAEDPDAGPTGAQPCETQATGRGCLYLTGGVIEGRPGVVGYPDGRGYVRRFSYDRCAASRPPPHFPVTGVFRKGPYYRVDAKDFEISSYFDLISRSDPVSF